MSDFAHSQTRWWMINGDSIVTARQVRMIDFAHSYELRHASLDQGVRYSEIAM